MRCPGWASRSQACHRGESLDFLEWRSGPVNRAEDDGDDSRLIGIMPVNSTGHLDTVAEIRGHKVITNKQEDDLCAIEVLHDLGQSFSP